MYTEPAPSARPRGLKKIKLARSFPMARFDSRHPGMKGTWRRYLEQYVGMH